MRRAPATAAATATAVAGAALAAALAPAAAQANDVGIAMPTKTFSPSRLTIVSGDRVTWRNQDFTPHQVRAVDGTFDSGILTTGASWSQTFSTPGADAFFCPIHPFMQGEVDVKAALLAGPPGSVLAGEAAQLTGRAPAGTASVGIERQAVDGSWSEAGSAPPAADGTFAFPVRLQEPTAFRARTSAGTSAPVTVQVAPRIDATLKLRHGTRVLRIELRTQPATPGLRADLQLYSRERFAWRRVAHAKLARDGRVAFSLRHDLRGRARVVLSRGTGAPALVITRPIRLKDGRRAAEAPMGHHHGHPMA